MKRVLLVVGFAAAMLAGGAAVAPAALAHSELVSSDPTDGAVLDAPPTIVSFTFNEPLLPDFVRFIATDPSGVTGDLPVSSVEGPTATITWPAEAPGGEWTVNYRVVSQDGHPIEGGITFAYAAASPTPTPTSSSSSPTPAPSPDPTTSSAQPSPDPTSAVPSPATSPAADSGAGSSGLVIAGIAVGLIIVVGIVVALVARRRT